MQSFLEKLDQFDLNNFIRSICFDELKVPTMPIQLPGSRSYFGIREFMTAELDYLKATVLSPSMENVLCTAICQWKKCQRIQTFH